MAAKKKSKKPKVIGAKIDYLRIGPKWTSLKISLPTKHLQK
jgi:hypothetical protein